MDLIIKINSPNDDPKNFQDGDVVQAFCNDRIHLCHAEMICDTSNFSLNNAGFRNPGTLLEKFLSKTNKYKFIRVNGSEVKRVNLLTNEEDTLSPTMNSEGELINAYEYISRRLKNPEHKIFGTEQGKEIWYGSRLNMFDNASSIDDIWNDIETHTDNLKINHGKWPFSDIEKSKFLPIKCTGFKNGSFSVISNDTASNRSDSVYDNNSDEASLVAKRKWQIPYWDLSGSLSINIDDVRDMQKQVDARLDSIEDMPKADSIHIDKVQAGIITI